MTCKSLPCVTTSHSPSLPSGSRTVPEASVFASARTLPRASIHCSFAPSTGPPPASDPIGAIKPAQILSIGHFGADDRLGLEDFRHHMDRRHIDGVDAHLARAARELMRIERIQRHGGGDLLEPDGGPMLVCQYKGF